jgi:hypothetical protein
MAKPGSKTPVKNKEVADYCMSISLALHKAEKLQAEEAIMKKVDQTVDMLKKAEAICASMGFTPPITFSDSTLSSSEGSTLIPESSTLSSSASPFSIDGTSQLCTLIGKAGKRGGIQMCRYDCSGKTKVMACQ